MSNIELIQQRDQKIAELLDELAELKQQKSLVVDTNKMVSNFLSWKLPSDFSPDAGISFKNDFNEHTPWPMKHNPTGTNLFNATQAKAMIEAMLVDAVSDGDARGLTKMEILK